jgi:hypothetical protein
MERKLDRSRRRGRPRLRWPEDVEKNLWEMKVKKWQQKAADREGWVFVIKSLTLRLLMSYIYGAPILDVSRSHTTTQHSR